MDYGEDSSLYCPHPGSCIASRCQRWDMDMNHANTNGRRFSRSKTSSPSKLDILIGNEVIHSCNSLKLLQLEVTLDSNLAFESHIRKTSSLFSRRAVSLRKCWLFNGDEIF